MNLNLRKFEDKDIETFERWLKKEHAKWFGNPQDWIKEVKGRKGEFSFVNHFIAEENGYAFGFCQYYIYNQGGESWHGNISENGTYSIDYLIGEEDFLGKGYGKEMVRLLCDKAFNMSVCKRIIVNPELENALSCKTLLANGFEYDKENSLFIKSNIE